MFIRRKEFERMVETIKDAWECIYGRKSHMTLAGKLLIGVPLAPMFIVGTLTFVVLDALFVKRIGD